mmetsp:Transcript_8847/g.26521  ORF Transcript_8847/g.26521 Transcript_8847/m.26521 type:complete len:193 (-) Transcript_8847:5155-5733(-)
MDVTILPLSLCQFVSSSPSSRTCKTADNQRENNLTHTGLLLSRHKNHVLGGAINNKTCTSSRQCQSPSQYICSELLSGCYGGQQPALASKDTHHQSELSQLSPLLGAGRGAFTRSGDTGLAGRAPGGDTGCCTGCLCTSSGDTPAAALPGEVGGGGATAPPSPPSHPKSSCQSSSAPAPPPAPPGAVPGPTF